MQKKLFLFLIAVFILVVLFALNGCFVRMIYPKKYKNIVRKYSQEYNVRESLVYSVIKVESDFEENVKSSAGAVGLMQLTPDTFRWLQKKKGVSILMGEQKLVDSEININYGVYFLSILFKKYSDECTALCAYNAGVGRVDNWLKKQKYSKDGKVLLEIPYEETRNYVQRVMKTERIYKKFYS